MNPRKGSTYKEQIMGRKSLSNYTEAGRTVLMELGGGPISSQSLVAAAQERGLIGEGKWVYHNFLRKLRESGEFNTSVRGQVSMAEPIGADLTVAAPVAEVPAPEAVLPGENLGAKVDTTEV